MPSYPTKLVHELRGHRGTVNDVRFNMSGQYCVSAGDDRLVQLWNPSTGLHVHTYAGHGRSVLGVVVSPDNGKIASCGSDRAVILWDVGTGETLRRYTQHWERVNAVDFNEEATVIASGSVDATVCFWDCRSSNFTPIQILKEAKDSVTSVQVKGVEVVAGSSDGKVRTYDMRMSKVCEDCLGPAVSSARLSNDGNCLLASTIDSTVRLLDRSNGQLLNEFKGHKHTEYMVGSAWSNDDGHVVSGSEDGKIYVWDVLEGTPVMTLTPPESQARRVITAVDYHPTDTAMLSASSDGVLRLWA